MTSLPLTARRTEALLMLAIFAAAGLGFQLTSLDAAVRYGQPLWAAAIPALIPPVLLALLFGGLHLLLRGRRVQMEQLLLPVMALLSSIGLVMVLWLRRGRGVCLQLLPVRALLSTMGRVMVWRLRGDSGVYQQLLRGLVPGAAVIGVFILRPQWVER